MTSTETRSHSDADAASLLHLAELAAALGAERLEREARQLADRIAQGRFYVACVGQFKRGKSTLLNALLGHAVLPTGIVPVTAVPTVVRWGDALDACVQFDGGTWRRVPVETLGDYVSEERNPENRKGVVAVEVFAPSPLLASGLCLVDTPGIGSVFAGNTEATHAFVPHVDAALILVGVDPPLSGDELALATDVARQSPNVLVVLNKADRFAAAERAEAAAFASRVLRERLGREVAPIYQVSAAERLADGRATHDWARLETALQDLADTSARAIVHRAAQRGGARLAERLRREIARQRDDLTQPLDESAARLAALDRLVADAAQRALELGHLFAAEQQRLGRAFQRRREAFVAATLPEATRALHDRIATSGTTFGPHLRATALQAARDIGRARVEPWLAAEQEAAERAYAAVAERFAALANGFLDEMRRVGGLDDLPDAVGDAAGFTVPSRYFFRELHPLVYGSPVAWLGDAVRPARAVRARIERAATTYLRDLLNMNSTLVENDLDLRVVESRRRLEGEIQRLLRDVYLGAEASLARARAAHAAGREAVAAALGALDAARERLDAIAPRSAQAGKADDAR